MITANVDAPESARLSYVGQDNYKAGVALGEYVAPLLPEGAHIVIPVEVPGMSYAIDRSRGIVDGIKKTNPNITYEILDAGYERGTTTSRITGYLTGHPETKGVFCVGGLTTACTAGVIKDLGLIGKVVAGGFDLTPETLQGVKEGAIVVTIDQHPYLQGYLPALILWFMKEYLMGAWGVDTLIGKVDKTNVAEVEELAKQGYR